MPAWALLVIGCRPATLLIDPIPERPWPDTPAPVWGEVIDAAPPDTGPTDTGPREGVAQEEVPGTTEDGSSTLYDDDEVAEFEVTLSDFAINALTEEPFEYVSGAITYRGRKWDPVGVRVKGQNSFLPIDEKPSLKIKFDAYVDGGRFYGMSELTFNNLTNDYSMMHERVAYRLYREADLPAPRCGHARVSINDDDRGLYSFVETIDWIFLSRWFDDPDGSLFEVWDVDFKDEYIDDFQLESGPDDRTHLQGAADAMERDGSAAMRDLEDHVDVEQFLRWWAVGAVVGQFDSYPYSYPGDDAHVYDDPDRDRLVFLPHGMDETFYADDTDIEGVQGTLAKHCLEVSSCQDAFRAMVWDMAQLSVDLDQHAYFEEVADQIHTEVQTDSSKPYSTSTVMAYQEVMGEFIAEREDTLTELIGAP